MKALFKLWMLLWLALLVAGSLWAAMVLGRYMINEMMNGLWWLAVVLAFFMLFFTLLGVRVALIFASLARGRITPRLAWRDVRNLLGNAVFFAKTGWLK